MVEGSQRRLRGVEFAALVIGMAGGAGARLFEAAMQAVALRDLGLNRGMAVQTLGGLVALKGRVAKAALRFEGGVRGEPAQFNTRGLFGADLAGVKN